MWHSSSNIVLCPVSLFGRESLKAWSDLKHGVMVHEDIFTLALVKHRESGKWNRPAGMGAQGMPAIMYIRGWVGLTGGGVTWWGGAEPAETILASVMEHEISM